MPDEKTRRWQTKSDDGEHTQTVPGWSPRAIWVHDQQRSELQLPVEIDRRTRTQLRRQWKDLDAGTKEPYLEEAGRRRKAARISRGRPGEPEQPQGQGGSSTDAMATGIPLPPASPPPTEVPARPTAPRNAFLRFREDNRQAHLDRVPCQVRPHDRAREASKIAGWEWQKLEGAVKRRYYQDAAKALLQYHKDVRRYYRAIRASNWTRLTAVSHVKVDPMDVHTETGRRNTRVSLYQLIG